MQKLVPHLWYDKEAKEAALFYISLFENSKLQNVIVLENTPSGDAEVVNFQLAGQDFQEEVETKWKALSDGGVELMPLGEYPFSKCYSWVQDRYGLSWQLMLSENLTSQKITPSFLFSNEACGKTEEAICFYTEIFENSAIGMISRYKEGEAESSKAKINYASFKLYGIDFSAMDNGYDADFNFNEAFSIVVNCKDQQEIDYFWDKLSAYSEAEQCGWVKDKFGVSWQIVPDNMNDLLFNGTKEEVQRVTEAFLKMKKFDINALENARIGN
ncbi:MAG: hypothetical protein K0Q47_1153 [Sedimentibacter sp.]|nr:hypothetical protein [Sedimentibacter sp.]